MLAGILAVAAVAFAGPRAVPRGSSAWPAGCAVAQVTRAHHTRAPRLTRCAMADEVAAPTEKRGLWSRLKAKLPWRKRKASGSGSEAAGGAAGASESAAPRASSVAAAPAKGAGLPDLSADDVADDDDRLSAALRGGWGVNAGGEEDRVGLRAEGEEEEDDDDDEDEEDEEDEDDNVDEDEDDEEEDAAEESMDPILEESDVARTVWIVDILKEDGEKERAQVLFDDSGKALWEIGVPPIPRTGTWNLRPDRLLFTRPFLAGFVGFKETYVAESSVDADDNLKLRTKGILRGWGYFSPAVQIGSFVMVRKATDVGKSFLTAEAANALGSESPATDE